VTLLLAAVAVVVVQQELWARRLAAEIAILRRQGAELDRLRIENRSLADKQLSSDELTRLRRQHADLEQLQIRMEKLGGHAAPLPRAVAASIESTPSADWKFAGRATPRAAFESVLWSATHQDLDRLAATLSFDPKGRAQMDDFFAQLPAETQRQYGSVEKIAATMLAADLPPNLSAMSALSDSIKEDTARLFMRVERDDGTHRDTFFNFQKAADGWHLVVPPSVLAGYETQLTAGSTVEKANSPAP
jgi:hypothetical protein